MKNYKNYPIVAKKLLQAFFLTKYMKSTQDIYHVTIVYNKAL